MKLCCFIYNDVFYAKSSCLKGRSTKEMKGNIMQILLFKRTIRIVNVLSVCLEKGEINNLNLNKKIPTSINSTIRICLVLVYYIHILKI